jgi:hypothetical protein
MLKQFNPDNTDYGRWVEQERRNLFELLRKNPYFRYSFSITIALLLAATACAKQSVDHRRAMWITAEMMADLYNQDAYSRQVAQEAIERYNKHIERCNRAIEAGESLAVARGPYALPRRETRQREIATLPEKSCGGNLRSWRRCPFGWTRGRTNPAHRPRPTCPMYVVPTPSWSLTSTTCRSNSTSSETTIAG